MSTREVLRCVANEIISAAILGTTLIAAVSVLFWMVK